MTDVAEDIEAVRRRLAARGLITHDPHLRIRDLVPAPEPPSEATALAHEKNSVVEDDTVDLADEVGEPFDEPEFGPSAAVNCPACRQADEVVIAATGFRCSKCAKVWRWAACGSCAELAVVIARQESWRCGGCGHYSRSWWRTTTAPREAERIADRKRHEAAAQHRARQLAIARRRRWKLLGGGVLVVAAVALAATVFTSNDAATPAEHARLACNRFVQFKSDSANGALTPRQIDDELAAIAKLAELARADVQVAAATLASSGRPGDATFLVASTAMTDACSARP